MGAWIAMTILAVAFGGFLGAISRYFVSLRLTGMKGILCVNILGSFLFGLSLQADNESGAIPAFWLIGFLGAFTTFTTFSVQFVETWMEGKVATACSYAVVTLLGGFLFVWLGWWLGGI